MANIRFDEWWKEHEKLLDNNNFKVIANSAFNCGYHWGHNDACVYKENLKTKERINECKH